MVAEQRTKAGFVLVDDHVLQVLEELDPLGVVGKDAGVQHVWVGDHHVPCCADGLSGVDRGVAVVGVGLDVYSEVGDQAVELVQLILGEGLGGKEIHGPGLGILQQGVEDRDVVAQCLA